MMERILYLHEQYCAVEENGRLVEYIPVNSDERTGDILRGRVERIMKSLQCAFVDIGRKKSGFLPLQENSKTFQGSPVHSGDEVIVQIRKEERGEKGAFLSRDLTLAGNGLLLMPMNRFIGISSRIHEPELRKNLKEIGSRLCEKQEMQFGLVMRSAAAGMSFAELQEETNDLWERWKAAMSRAGEHPEDRIILCGNSAAEDLTNDYRARGIDRVERNAELPVNLQRQLKEARQRTISLPHGGNIVIDPCEALTVIDVNSASDGRDLSRRETILQTNLEACREIVIQTRLRNLSGILIVDMIDMESETDQSIVLEELSRCFESDRIKTVIHGLTRLGLVEMTRKRSRDMLRIT